MKKIPIIFILLLSTACSNYPFKKSSKTNKSDILITGLEWNGAPCGVNPSFKDTENSGTNRLMIFGDSISEQGDGFAVRFAAHIGLEYENHAYGGSLIQCQTWNLTNTRLDPTDTVVFMMGHNDVMYGMPLNDFTKFAILIKNTLDQSGAKVIIGTPMRMLPESYTQSEFYQFRRGSAELAKQYRDAIYMIFGNDSNYTIVDTFNLWEPKASLYLDGVHPNEAGKQILTDIYVNNAL